MHPIKAMRTFSGRKTNTEREYSIPNGGRVSDQTRKKWSIAAFEGLAMVEGVKQYHTHLSANEFEIEQDHLTLTDLQRVELSGKNLSLDRLLSSF